MTLKGLLSENDLEYLNSISKYLDNAIDVIYTDNKKSYLFYAKTINEMDLMYEEYLNIIDRLVKSLRKAIHKENAEPLLLNSASIGFFIGGLIHPTLLFPSLMCLIRSKRLARETFAFNYDENVDKLIEPIVSIEKRLRDYDEVIKNIMESYINYDENKGYIDVNEPIDSKELYYIANCFIAFLLYKKDCVDLNCVRKEVLDKICEIMQNDMNTAENDLLVLLDMTDDYLLGRGFGKARTLYENNV